MGKRRIGDCARGLRAMLAPMPESDVLMSAWFRSAETLIGICEVLMEI